MIHLYFFTRNTYLKVTNVHFFHRWHIHTSFKSFMYKTPAEKPYDSLFSRCRYYRHCFCRICLPQMT